MKLNKYIGLAAMAMAFTACQQDMLEGENMQNGIYTLSGNMAGGAAMSRAQVVLGNTDGSKESFMWNNGDAFALYQNMESHVFTISSDYNEISSENKKAASFTTDNPASAAKYVAIYPADVEVADDNSAKFELQNVINFTGADTQAKQNGVWRSYLMKNMFMMAKGTLQDGVTNVVNFEHLCAMARITYTNTTDEAQSIGSIRMGGEQNITTSMSYYIPDEYQNGSGSTNWYTVNTTGLTVAAGATTDFYIMFFPSGFGTRLDIVLNINSMEKSVSLDIADVIAANTGAEEFEAGKRYWFKLTSTEDELVWTKDFSSDVVTIKNAELSQALYGVLGADKVSLNDDNYAVMIKEFAESVESLNFGSRKYTITSLEGIEYFKGLRVLTCAYSGLEVCDLSKNTQLLRVYIYGNNLTSLDLSNNAALTAIDCAQNYSLQTLKIDNCTLLEYLNVDDTQLQSISIPNPETIWQLAYSRTPLNLDLTQFTGMQALYCNGNQLTSINLTTQQKRQLVELECESNQLSSLDLSEYPNLQHLNCVDNQLTELNVSHSKNLVFLRCAKNRLTSIDLSALVNLEQLDIIRNKLTSLDVSKLTKLKSLCCQGNMLKTLDLTNCTSLKGLQCGEQTDLNGKQIPLELKLADNLSDLWETQWKLDGSNADVILYTGPSVDPGNGNTGGSDFTIEGIY